jgi:hypothetical protein
MAVLEIHAFVLGCIANNGHQAGQQYRGGS